MFEEPWMEDARRQNAWDRWLKTRPVCTECRQPITDDEFLPTEDGAVCPACVRWKMVRIG